MVPAVQFLLHFFELRAVHMKQLSAHFALAVKTGTVMIMFFFRHIFITGRVARIDNVFIDNSLFHKLFERPVDGRLSDRVFAGTEMLAQFSCGDMRTALPAVLFCIWFRS